MSREDVMAITGQMRPTTVGIYDHRSIKFKVQNADFINNIQAADFVDLNVPIQEKNAIEPAKVDKPVDKSLLALKEHFNNNRDEEENRPKPGGSGVVFQKPGGSGFVFQKPGDSGVVFQKPGCSGVVFQKPGGSGVVFQKPGTSKVPIAKPVSKVVVITGKTDNGMRFIQKAQNENNDEPPKDAEPPKEAEQVQTEDLTLEDMLDRHETQWDLNPNFGTGSPAKKAKNSDDGENYSFYFFRFLTFLLAKFIFHNSFMQYLSLKNPSY